MITAEGAQQEVNVIILTYDYLSECLVLVCFSVSFLLIQDIFKLLAAMGPSTTHRQVVEKEKPENKRLVYTSTAFVAKQALKCIYHSIPMSTDLCLNTPLKFHGACTLQCLNRPFSSG